MCEKSHAIDSHCVWIAMTVACMQMNIFIGLSVLTYTRFVEVEL